MFFLVGIFFLRHSEEVSVDLFNSTIWGMAEKDEDVIAFDEVSGLDRQRGERPIFAENAHKVTRRNTEGKKKSSRPFVLLCGRFFHLLPISKQHETGPVVGRRPAFLS